VFPNGTTLTSFTSSRTGTEFSWEFPVLGKYQIFASKMNPFIEAGPSFRPAENRELIGVTAGVGVETHMRGLNVSPAVRYTVGKTLADIWVRFRISTFDFGTVNRMLTASANLLTSAEVMFTMWVITKWGI